MRMQSAPSVNDLLQFASITASSLLGKVYTSLSLFFFSETGWKMSLKINFEVLPQIINMVQGFGIKEATFEIHWGFLGHTKYFVK